MYRVDRLCAAVLALALASLPALVPSPALGAKPAAKPQAAAKAPGPVAPPAAPAASAAALDPTARTQEMIAAFKRVPLRSVNAPKATVDKAFADLDAFLDFDTLAQEPIRPHLAKLDPAQRAAYAGKFREVVRLVAYPDSGEFFRKAAVKLGAPKAGKGGTWVELETRLPEDGTDTRLGLLWRPVGGALRIADLTFDGDSLVRDYQNQFGRILDKEGAAGLLKRLDDKKAELAKGK
jgi:ABC-type transporter MlaC component